MIVSPSPAPARPVHATSPVNRSHPLNQGRLAWWLTLPSLAGGSTWPDLMGLYHGAFTSMGNTSNGWRSTTRPGGWGHVDFDGSAGMVACGNRAALALSTAGSIACWCLSPIGAQASFTTMGGMEYSAAHTSPFMNYRLDANFSAGGIAMDVGNATTFNGATSGVQFVANTWYRVVGTFDNATIRIYLNGVSSGSLSYTGPAIHLDGAFWIAGNPVNECFHGSIDDFSVWNRTLSPAEVAADFELSRRGYPGVLNRY